nr:hypothetical protein [Tanacetum cinerariifolium]
IKAAFVLERQKSPIPKVYTMASNLIFVCLEGLLGKHFKKLIQCDLRLNLLSQQVEVELDSLYFEPRTSVFDEPKKTNEYELSMEARHGLFDLHIT